ncbi:hypothetical protein I7I53_03609 [Histoplasma capsulatum var. duboisii H88]|uniref:Uncharacterized protein n=1 Tax=Ajellomyces capsulatus (strain H88) TaxID=544711 RepID=A0A8A1LRC2_AJEC8|nr:hypothetical protein I7I53_03609 [Histoplasma capsulatum var. duboisii H88]
MKNTSRFLTSAPSSIRTKHTVLTTRMIYHAIYMYPTHILSTEVRTGKLKTMIILILIDCIR